MPTISQPSESTKLPADPQVWGLPELVVSPVLPPPILPIVDPAPERNNVELGEVPQTPFGPK